MLLCIQRRVCDVPGAPAKWRAAARRCLLVCDIHDARFFALLQDSFVVQTKRVSAATIATWLILPVVIRLSQRLSHACLSISESETANGSLYQL